MTIRKRLTLWYASLLTFIIILLGAVVFAVMRFTMISNIDNTLEETAELVETNSRFVVLPFGQQNRFDVELPELDFSRASGIEIQVWMMDGQGEFDFRDASANLQNDRNALDHESLGTTEPKIYNNVSIEGVWWRVRTSPIWFGDQFIGNIQVAGSLQTVNAATQQLLIVMLVSCGLAIAGSAILSMWLAGRMLRPIEYITHAAAHIAGTKDLSTRLPWHGPMDELGRLTAVFNQMMSRLEHLFSVQQRFVADVSHELRTPLTGIMGNLDMVKRYGADEESLDAINSEAQRMSRLVNDLLLLARADYGGLEIELYPLDLDTVVMETFQHARGLAQGRDIHLRLAYIEPLRVNGNTDRIKQMLLNLIENALKFTPEGGTVTIDLHRDGLEAVISVKDTGVGIAEQDLERIFDRFYQSDPSRTHQDESTGFGLGLSIAKWITEAHKGRISVESKIDEGTTFFIRLPLIDLHDIELTNGDSSAVTRPRLAAIRRRRAPSPEEISG
jgi:two-component system, OmpR family, sensor kinase